MFSTLALVGFAVAGFAAVDVRGQVPVALSVQTALAEFGLAGTWAQECARPYVALTFESGANAQLVMRREKDGVRFDIRSAAKLSDDLVSLDLRPISVLNDGKWRAPSAAETNPVPQFVVGKRGNDLVSPWEMQLRLGVPAGVYTRCSTLGSFVSPQPRDFPPPPPPPRQ